MKFSSDIVIGLEIHVELDTETKLFCGCSTANAEPNTHCCEVCLGHPGSKPVINKKAIDFALKLALALNCNISSQLIFSRKSYFYPDMAKNYQITQYEIPLGKGGELKLKSGKPIGIVRVHIEEDPASLVHEGGMHVAKTVLVDYNRSGRPLVEIVTQPDLESPDEARDFMRELIRILTYLKIFDLNKGIIKADANVSIRESGYVRSEVKNITGFKEIERALNYEVERQRRAVKEGVHLKQETRSWDSAEGITRELRTKETEEDYGYIFDPDLVVTEITQDMIKKAKAELPELAQEKVEKFIEKYKIDKVDAEVLSQHLDLAELFERIAKKVEPVFTARWLRKELLRVLNYNKLTLEKSAIDEKNLTALLKLLIDKKITPQIGRKLIEDLVLTSFDVEDRVKKEGLAAVSDTAELEKLCKEAIEENPRAIEDYKSGEEKALNFVIGQVMKKTKGKATPNHVRKILKQLVR